MTRVVQGKDGKWHTVDDGPSIDLERARRECRDVIQGNVPFHVDPFTPQADAGSLGQTAPACFCAYIGGECDVCRDDASSIVYFSHPLRHA